MSLKAIVGWIKTDKNEDPNIAGIYRMFAPIIIEGRARLVKLTVKEFHHNQDVRLYSLESLEVDNEKSPVPDMVDADLANSKLISDRPYEASVDILIDKIQKSNKNQKEISNTQEQQLLQNSNTPRGSFMPQTNTISLYAKADFSTLTHEQGHFYLEKSASSTKWIRLRPTIVPC